MTSSGEDMSNHLRERFERYYFEIDGSTHPNGIPAAAVIERFLLTARGEPLFELSLDDALVLARFAHRHCTDRGASDAFQALRTPENLASPEAAGRAMNRLVAEQEQAVSLRWEAMLADLSEPTRSMLRDHLEYEVLPEVRYQKYDFEGLWTTIPEMFERWRNPPDPEPLSETGREQAAVGSQQSDADKQLNVVYLRGGTPEWDRMCAGEFVHWIELPLVKRLAVEHGLDTSDAGLEAFLRERSPRMFEFDGLAAARERELIWADALQAMVDGATPNEAYRRYRLDLHQMTEESWERFSADADQAWVDQMRSNAQRHTPEHMKREFLDAIWNRFAYWEDQLVDRLFPHQCGASDGDSTGLRTRRVVACLEPARAWYLEYVAEAIGEAPPGWQEHLLLFRPQPKAASLPASD